MVVVVVVVVGGGGGVNIMHWQIVTRNCNAMFRSYCVVIARKKMQPLRLHSALAKSADGKICQNIQGFKNFSAIFSEEVALPTQSMLHKEICTCNRTAIIS